MIGHKPMVASLSVGRRHALARLAQAVAVCATSALAVAITYFAGRDAYYALVDPPRLPTGEIARWAPGLAPAWVYPDVWTTASHGAFHVLQASGFGVLGGLLLLFLAWDMVRQEHARHLWALLGAGVPAVVLPLSAEGLFGPWHREAQVVLVPWVLSVSAMALCLALRRPARSR